MTGPLDGLRVVELAGLGPAPHTAMMLADLGAEVTRVERPIPEPRSGPPGGGEVSWVEQEWVPSDRDPANRGRRLLEADLRNDSDRHRVLELVETADVLVEGNRPGVTERLGVGPDVCLQLNPRLVYTRLTGWGQTGPRAGRAGHDINFLSLTGVLAAIGPVDGPPVVPLNLVADMGGGSMLALTGILAALWERERSGQGQVLDIAMVDGVLQLAQTVWALRGMGNWDGPRGTNLLDGGAPFYGTYACRDGRFVAVGSIEPQFYAALLDGLELDPATLPERLDRRHWPELRETLADRFATRTRDEWDEVFRDTDGCVTPVVELDEVAAEPHLTARGSFTSYAGTPVAAPAPRFSRTPTQPG